MANALQIQCDQMLAKKEAQIFQRLPKKQSQQFLLKKWCFSKQPKMPPNMLGYFYKKIYQKNFQKSPNLVTLLAMENENVRNGVLAVLQSAKTWFVFFWSGRVIKLWQKSNVCRKQSQLFWPFLNLLMLQLKAFIPEQIILQLCNGNIFSLNWYYDKSILTVEIKFALNSSASSECYCCVALKLRILHLNIWFAVSVIIDDELMKYLKL